MDSSEMADRAQLLVILSRVLEFVDCDENSFVWSAWRDRQHGVDEIKSAIAAVEGGGLPVLIDLWFAPTGDLQEVAISSGWGEEYLQLAARFDAVWARLRPSA